MRRFAILLIAVLVICAVMAMAVNAATTSKKQTTSHKAYKATHAKAKIACRTVCKPVRHVRHVRHVKRAVAPRRGAGPTVLSCPKAPAPVVNIPQQAPPVVNVAAPPPGVGITTDDCSIFIVQGDQLMVLDKNTLCLKKKTTLSGQPTE